VLSRQPLPVIERAEGPRVPKAAALAGVVREPEKGAPQVVLAAAGSEVSLCAAAAELLEKQGIAARVVSIPCQETFADASPAERDALLPPGVPRLFVELGSAATWRRWVGTGDDVYGLARFGASAPGKVVAEKLGFTAEEVARRARALLKA
jgi:transketolase